ncbi:type IV secretory system conjugative DNA transfer family protein [Rhodobacterales bacterium HKCCE4037]|nr:type IV secretory system conjugative DNA transfer family protein [Rhodobacterales bacterium HKCCE4037]
MSSFDKTKIVPAGIIIFILIATFIVPLEGIAQSLFSNGYNSRYRGPNAAELGFIRGSFMAVSFGVGLLIGWLMSPESRKFRRVVLAVAGGTAIFFALVSNTPMGWSLTSILSIVLFFVGIGYWVGRTVQKLGTVPTTYGSAAWATIDEMRRKGLCVLTGIRLGVVVDGENLQRLSYNGDRHGLLVAPARTHKGTSVIVPNLLTYEGPVLTIDPKGENVMMTGKARQEMGQTVYKVDPWNIADVDGIPTARFNPLDWLVAGDPDITENAMILADAIIVKQSEKDSFWDQTAVGYLQGTLLYVATDEREEGQRHLPRVRDLMMLDGDDMKAFFERMLESPHHVVAATGARMLQMDDKLLSNVMASVQSHTQFLDSPRLRESLSASDFRFEDLKAGNMSVYLCAPADRLEAFSRWLRLLVQQAITVNARNIENKPKKPILFLLDEMAALGRLSSVEQAYGLMAGFGMQLYGVVQDLSQLKRIYGDGFETFIGNSGLIQYFGSRDRMTAEYFSALCGETTVWNFSSAVSRTFGSSGGQSGSSSSSSFGNTDTTAAAQRKLAYPDELMRLPEDTQLVFVENMNPIIAKKVPWFKDEKLKSKGVSLP